MMKSKVLCIICLFSLSFSIAQDNDLGSQQVDVTESFIPSIPESKKINVTPDFIDSSLVLTDFQYQTINLKHKVFYEIDTITPASFKGLPIDRLYRSYIKLIFGNGHLPSFQANYNTTRDKKLNYGFSLGYQNLVGKVVSNYSDEKVSVAAKSNNIGGFIKGIYDFGTLSANFSRFGYNFNSYGFDPSLTDEDEQYWGYTTLDVFFRDNHQSTIFPDYTIFISASDLNEKAENCYTFGVDLSKNINRVDYKLGLTMDYDLNFSADDFDFNQQEISETIYTLSPSGTFDWNGIKASLGFSSLIISNPDATETQNKFFPNLQFDYIISKKYSRIFLKFDGGIIENSYTNVSLKNPFVFNVSNSDNGSLGLKNSFKNYDIQLGHIADLGLGIRYEFVFSYAQVDDMQFFYIDGNSTFKNKFNVKYDNATHLKLNTHLAWNIDPTKSLDLKLAYNSYNLDSLNSYSYLPTFEVDLRANYNLANKILSFISLNADINRYKSDLSNSNEVSLVDEVSDIFNASLGAEYRYNKVFSFYIEAYRVLGAYEEWKNYPVLSPQLLLGLSYKF